MKFKSHSQRKAVMSAYNKQVLAHNKMMREKEKFINKTFYFDDKTDYVQLQAIYHKPVTKKSLTKKLKQIDNRISDNDLNFLWKEYKRTQKKYYNKKHYREERASYNRMN